MYFYIGIFIFCTLMLIINNKLKNQKDKKIFEIITLIVLCLISGTRYYLGGTDYYVYKAMFEVVPKVGEFNFATIHDIYRTFEAEKGYLFFCSIIKTLGFNFFGFTLIHSVIFYTFMYVGLKKYTKNFNLLIIVFLYKMFFYDTFISMRQSITIAIFFMSIGLIKNKKMYKYFLCCLLATTFHRGALVLFLIYFINKLKLTRKKIIILNCIFIPTILFSILNIQILTPFQGFINLFSTETAMEKASNLINSSVTVGISPFHTLEYFLIMALVIINYSNIVKQDENAEFIIKLFLVLLPLFTLFRGYVILTREKDYFLFTYAIILQYLCQIKQKKYTLIVQSLTLVVCLFGFCRFVNLFDRGGMIPYQSYINKSISIRIEKE